MTEQEADDQIHLWVMCARFGAPDEHDSGDPAPREYGMVSFEKKYLTPQIWYPPEPKAHPDDIRAAYNRVEAVFNALERADQRLVTHWYFGQRGPNQKDAQARFKAGVMRDA